MLGCVEHWGRDSFNCGAARREVPSRGRAVSGGFSRGEHSASPSSRIRLSTKSSSRYRRSSKPLNALVTIYEDDKFHEAIERLELGISDLERRLQTLDDLIPTSYFREHFDVSQASAVALADYAALLGQFAGDDSARLDRIQYLLTLLLSLFISPKDDSPIRRRQLLAEALSQRQRRTRRCARPRWRSSVTRWCG